jgi:23S rRNA pseudouridine1911/1915/1917 synthase
MDGTRLVVPAAARGDRIDRVVATLLGEPRSQAQARVHRGDVTVDGVVVRKSYRVRGGEQIDVAPAPVASVATPPPVPVRYADDHVTVVAKPAGMVVHAGAGGPAGTRGPPGPPAPPPRHAGRRPAGHGRTAGRGR